MRKLINQTVITLFILSGSLELIAQQEPLLTQYAFNQIALNPAIAGTHDGISLTGMSRIQWAGLDGAPETHLFSAHMPIAEKRMGVGLTFMYDKIGVSKENSIGINYAYNIQFEKSVLSFGLRGNFDFFNSDFSQIDLGGISDPNFQGAGYSDFKMNFGSGIYYYSPTYYFGFSVPYINKSSFEGNGNSDISYEKERIFYIMGGYVFPINEYFKIKPYTNIKIPANAPVQIDINASLIYDDKIFLGVGYRPNDSFSVLFEWQIKDALRLGYASDVFTNDSSELGGVAQEFLISYIIRTKKDEVVNPRYF